MRVSRSVGIMVAALALLGSACSDMARTSATFTPTPYPGGFDRDAFGRNSTTIDNPWWPLKVGTQLTWEGHAFEGDELIDRRIVFTVTDLTKDIGGVRTLVGWDRDFNNGVLAEAELIFLAQAKDGAVWHFGQYAERFDEEGALEGGTAWLAGYLDGAKAGVLMQANPQLGSPSYSEGYAPPPFFWDDHAKVYQVGRKTCVVVGCYTDVLVIQEFEPTKPGASQLKYYARGVGSVQTGWLGAEEEERETLELVKVVQLTPEQLVAARLEALKLETRASLFGRTPPIEPPRATTSPEP